jgi:L-ascorbate metabolism protein UlaG (beta-lactamase superfamily)
MRPREPGFDDRGVVTTSIEWLGHATVLIEIDRVRVLTDPVLRDRIGPLVRTVPRADPPGRVDYVLLSHLHADHADLPSLRELAPPARVIAPHPAGGWLRRRGLRDVQEVRPGVEVDLDGVRVLATCASHDCRRYPLGPAGDPIGYIVKGRRPVYFAGDTDLFEAMAELRGRVAVALLPVWGWGPRLGPRHLDPERAARAAALIAPQIAIPIHWGTFASRLQGGRMADPTLPAHEFLRLAAHYAPAVEVRLLAPGDHIGPYGGIGPGSVTMVALALVGGDAEHKRRAGDHAGPPAVSRHPKRMRPSALRGSRVCEVATESSDRVPAGQQDRATGWVIFAGAVLLVAGCTNIIEGIAAVEGSSFFVRDAHYIFGDLNSWGWVVWLIGIAQGLTALGVVIRNQVARWLGVAFAALNALAQLLLIQAYPLWSLALFSLDIIVIYGLVVYGGAVHPDRMTRR